MTSVTVEIGPNLSGVLIVAAVVVAGGVLVLVGGSLALLLRCGGDWIGAWRGGAGGGVEGDGTRDTKEGDR